MVSPVKNRLSNLKLNIALGVILASAVFHCTASEPIFIRVLVLKEIQSANLKINGYYEILDRQEKNILYRGNNLNTTLLVDRDTILLGKVNLKSGSIFIKPVEDNIIRIDGREFKGGVQIMRNKNVLKFSVVNYLELEEYTKGVLYHEVSHFWPMEALKAQAIVSRTFAAFQHRINKNKDYDVTADVYSQVYGGKTSERYRTNRAVEETAGKVLIYSQEVFPAYYSATCAGFTEDASNLWDINIEPLKGVKCGFCINSPHFRWQREISIREIKEALNKSGLKITGEISNIAITKRNKSGRVSQLKIYFGKEEFTISGKDFRNALGPNIIRSTNFFVSVNKGFGLFEGLGWGHGVGLCQWGAYFMAKQGYKYDEILKYYYPTAQVSLIVNR